MLILLPPSETKAAGGGQDRLDLAGLLFPELRPHRRRLITELGRLSKDLPAARKALGVSAGKDGEIHANTVLRTGPALPALARYTGVLFDALDAPGMSAAERARADARLLVTSALFGVLRATDRVPAYRLSAGSHLPGLGSVAGYWRPALTPLLAALDEPVVDLRSGAYAAFAALPEAITVRVVTERPDGSRAVVSHFNKATKGRLARLLAVTRAEVHDAAGVARLARRGGMRVERTGPRDLQIVT